MGPLEEEEWASSHPYHCYHRGRLKAKAKQTDSNDMDAKLDSPKETILHLYKASSLLVLKKVNSALGPNQHRNAVSHPKTYCN